MEANPRKIIESRIARPRSGRVILRRCDDPSSDKVRSIIAESFKDLGIKPGGKALIKPNCVTANRKYIHHSYTDPRIVGQAVRHLQSEGLRDIAIGESGAYGIPSRLFMREAGYLDLAATGAKVMDFNLEPAVRVTLEKAAHHKTVLAPKSILDSDFLIWAPKLKYHICCTVTCALKLNIGILLHKERMLYHDDRLDEKIADLLELGYPDAIVTDAINIGTGFESAPHAIKLGVIMISDDPIAMDIAACRVLNFDPRECAHLTIAMERGYGPKSAADVRIEGDVSLEELRAVTKGHVSEYQDIHKVDTPIKFYCGNEPTRDRFCHGGCLAAVKGCLGTIDKRRPGSVKNARKGAIVTGVYKGEVDAQGGVALLIGRCTRVDGRIMNAKKVVKLRGCPLGAKQLFTVIPRHFGVPNPMFDVRDAYYFIRYSLDKLLRLLFGRIGLTG